MCGTAIFATAAIVGIVAAVIGLGIGAAVMSMVFADTGRRG